MGIEDAILASDFIQVDKVVGVHYDTFGFIKIDNKAAVKAFNDNKVALMLPSIGETIEL